MKTILRKVGGWTPLVDQLAMLKDEKDNYRYGTVGAAIFGVVWRHCQMQDGICRASQETLGELIGVNSRMTMNKYLKRLVEDKYLIDTTPGLRNKPHIYKDAGKLNLAISIEAEKALPEDDPKIGVHEMDTANNEIGVQGGVHDGVHEMDMSITSNTREDERKSEKKGRQKSPPSPSAQAEAKNTSALADNNFPQIVKDIKIITNYLPPKDQWVFLEKKFPEGITDMNKARNYYNYARAKHINPQNYDIWLIEWYSTDGYYMHPKDKAKFYELYRGDVIQNPTIPRDEEPINITAEIDDLNDTETILVPGNQSEKTKEQEISLVEKCNLRATRLSIYPKVNL